MLLPARPNRDDLCPADGPMQLSQDPWARRTSLELKSHVHLAGAAIRELVPGKQANPHRFSPSATCPCSVYGTSPDLQTILGKL